MISLTITNDKIVNGTFDPKIIPKGEVDISFEKNSNLTHLPEGLKIKGTLNLSNSKIIKIPKGLDVKDLILRSTLIKELPADLKVTGILDLGRTNIEKLPKGLDVKGLILRKTLIKELPTDLKVTRTLDLGRTNIEKLPDRLNLKNLDIAHSKIKTLPEDLKVTGTLIANNTKIDKLPEGLELEEIYIGACKIKSLPENLKVSGTINLKGCDELIPTPKLIEFLEDHEINYKGNIIAVFWPKHFAIEGICDDIRIGLNKAIKKFKEKGNPGGAPNTKQLFHRFLNEYTEQRDGISNIIKSVDPILSLLEKNPNHLKWIEPIASIYLDACVNQPVYGMTEISSWVNIANQETLEDKVNSAKKLIALEIIKQSIIDSDRRSPEVEVEAGNVLLREVHKKLVEEGMEPWLGIPGSITYEGTVKSWINEDFIKATTNKVSEVINNPEKFEERVKLHLEANTDKWANILIPNDISKIQESYAKRKDELSDLMLGSDAEKIEKATNEYNLIEKEIDDKISKNVKAKIEEAFADIRSNEANTKTFSGELLHSRGIKRGPADQGSFAQRSKRNYAHER